MAVATWAFEHDQPAGSGNRYFACSLITMPTSKNSPWTNWCSWHSSERRRKIPFPDQRQTFYAFANQAALAVERASLAEQARQAELLQATEKLQTALLNSISHDLRTPLVSITGALSSLREESLNIIRKIAIACWKLPIVKLNVSTGWWEIY